MADCQIIQTVCKRAGERIAFPAFELVDRLARRWESNQPFSAAIAVRPKDRAPTGFEYASSGGVSAGKEPDWKKAATIGATILDGSITWTAQAISFDSLLHRIESVSYTVATGITNHARPHIDEPGSQQVPIEVSGGTASQTYDVVANTQLTTVGASSPLYELVLRVTIE